MKLSETSFIVLDVETTGIDPATDQIVDIALVECAPSVIHPLFSTLIKPGIAIPPEAMAVHHITNEMVSGAPTLSQVEYVIKQVTSLRFFFAAHNEAFDRSFAGSSINAKTPWICTYRLARHLWPDAPGFGNQVLRYWLKLDVQGAEAHRALGDAMVTAHLLHHEISTYLDNGRPDNLEAFQAFIQEPIRVYKMPFGKHKGMLMNEVPTDYFQWALRKLEDLDADLKWTMGLILGERKVTA